MARSAPKRVVAAKNFDIRVADASQADAHERPAFAQLRERLADGGECAIADDEGEHDG